MIRVFPGGYSQTNCNSNFNVNVTVNSYMNSSFSFSFSPLLKDLFVFTIMKLKSTNKIIAQFETISQCLPFLIIF